MLDPEDWRCPTCLDLAYKPAVNSACGHVFCFWCLHKAMSPYAPSACPICRAQYTNLPAICPKLHQFLACQFPETYAARRQETEEEEEEIGAQSPEPQASGPLPPPAAPGQWRPQHFLCDSPRCGRLLCRPAVLICGHAVCRDCLPGSSGSGASSQGTPAAATAASSSLASSSPGSARGAYECPACRLAARQPPAVCKQLADLLGELFAEESRRPEAEAQAAQEARQAEEQAAAAASTGTAAAQGVNAGAAKGHPGLALQTPPPSASPAGDQPEPQEQQPEAAPGGSSQPGGQPPAQAAQQSLSPSLTSALRRRQAEGGAQQAMAERLEQSLRRMTAGEEYVWHGVGCDGCGQYPIQGRRHKCLDCPEAIGFDLCGACMDRGLSDIVGRFNQRHTPEHRMRSVRPRITAMHMLKAANPELPMEQLMWLLEMALAPEGEEGEEGEEAGQQQQQASEEQQQQQQDGQQQGGQQQNDQQAGAAGDGGGSELLPVLRRGPRPAYDPAAEEPSPAAYASHQPQQRTGQQGRVQGPAGGEAEGLIDEPAVTEVHVALERLLLHSGTGSDSGPSSGSGSDAGGGSS